MTGKSDIIFDSRNGFFKTPQGAVKANTEMAFRLLVAEDLQPIAVRLIILYDRHNDPAVYDMDGGSRTPEETDDYLEFTAAFTIHDTGLYWYHFEVLTDEGLLRIGKDHDNRAVIMDSPSTWQQTVYRRAYDAPDWICGGIFYHAFVDRFHRSGRPRLPQKDKILREDWGGVPEWKPKNLKIYNNDFFGGDLEGIRQKLPYLAELHVTCLYLSPIFEAYSSHKYDTGNYEHIDPMFGSEADFEALCKSAAEYGIRVICDGVFAHTGSDSVYFDKYGHYGEKSGHAPGAYGHPDSPYRNWYFFHDDETYDCWWDFRTLPKLNKRDPGYVEYLTGENGIVRKWLRAGASGWRLDVADELPNDFLDALVSAAKTEKRDSIIIGEVWEDASNKIAYEERKNYFEGMRLDSVMNYPFRTSIIDFVRHGNAKDLALTVESIAENYPPEVLHCLMNVLGTHDSPRIITALAGADLGPDPSRQLQAETHLDDAEWERGTRLLKIASLIQMTLPGIPCIYYGDEAGTEGYKDPFNRTCYPWGHENADLLCWYKKITQIRASHPVYRQGAYRTIAAADGLFAFERFDPVGGESAHPTLMTVCCCGGHEQHLPLEGRWQDLLTGQVFEGTITVFPEDALLLERSNEYGF
ncbi:MAG: glycoside hydrolase family 13 protein [Firmicutes bacterium]|nr:glycoside hydrolase family 13 protein [Bacillota bacterium]